jgi:hypothetical protein
MKGSGNKVNQFITTRRTKAPEEKSSPMKARDVPAEGKVKKKRLYIPEDVQSEESTEEEGSDEESDEEIDQEKHKKKRVEDKKNERRQDSTPESSEEDEPTPKAGPRPFDRNIPVNVGKLPGGVVPKVVITKPVKSKAPVKETRFKDVEKKKEAKPPDKAKPLFRVGIEEELADRILHGELHLSALEALVVAPGVKRVLKRKMNNLNLQPRKMKTFVQVNKGKKEEPISEQQEVPYFLITDLEQPDLEVYMQSSEGLPQGALVQRDIADQFFKDRPDDRDKKIIVVAREAHDLRVTYPLINGARQMVECIMDNGSQIVSMDTKIAKGLGLTWDPEVVLHMQSANGELNPTRGLARNIPFRFGDIMVYLQVHIIDNCPYHLLVGRPFDVLCETVIENRSTGDQFITIHDPNSKRKVTVPTYARGEIPEIQLGPTGPPPPGSAETTNGSKGDAAPEQNSETNQNFP